MMYLFDASSIVNLIKRGVVKPFADGSTLDLALYESMNAIWKEYKLLNKLDEETAFEFIGVIGDVFEAIKVLSIRGFEDEIFKLSSKEEISIYDASYIYSAMRNRLTLVTDDRVLRDKASKYLRAISSREFIEDLKSP